MNAANASLTGWRIAFALAALFNFAVGAAVLARAPFLPAPAPEQSLTYDTAALLIITFGIGYAMVARNPLAQRGLALLGVIGKLQMPVLTGVHVLRGDAPLATFLLSIGDLVFAALFIAFLLRTRDAKAA